MWQKIQLCMLGLVVLLVLGGCSEPEIQALAFEEVPWQDGEVSVFRVTDVEDAFAGTARYDMLLIDGGLWNMRREVESQDMQEIVVVEMTMPGYRPSEATLVRIASDGVEQVRTDYDQGQVNLELTTKQNVTTVERISVPSDVRDQRTMVMLLRALPLAPGYAVRVNSFLPVVPLLDRVTVLVEGREQITGPAGEFETYHVVIQGQNVETEAWVGVDAPYPLVKYIDGLNGATYELLEFIPES